MTFRFSRMCAFGLAACGLFLSSVGQACERCQRSSNQQCSCQRDDRGLLHMVDSLAGNLHQGIKGFTSSDRDKKAGCGCATCQSKCDVAPNCGVEAKPGVAPNCGCEAHSGNRTTHASPPAYMPAYSPTYPAPQRLSPMDMPPIPAPVPTHNAIPIPAPLPDAQVDPFRDEDAAPNRVPARTIQYRRNMPNQQQYQAPVQSPASYGRRFDDQAGVMTYRIGDGLAAQLPADGGFQSAGYPTPRPSTTAYHRPVQSRPVQSRPVQDLQYVSPEVVPVSAVRDPAAGTKLQPVTSGGALRAVPLDQTVPSERSYYNPLR